MINLKNKKILITGAHGFLGKHLVKNLLKARGVPAKNLFLPTSRKFDLRKWNNCQKVIKNQDIFIHLAAKVGGIGYNQERPGELFYDNLIMGVQLIEAARLSGVEKLVTLGTVCAYPKFTPVPFCEENLWDGYPEETNAPYGLAKKMLLVQAQAYRKQYGFNAIYLLPVNMYGPNDCFETERSHVIAAVIKKIYDAQKQKKNYITVWGTGRPTREFIYVEDAAEAILLASEKYNKSEPVNIGSGEEISIKNLIKLIANLMNFKGEVRWDKNKPDGQPRRCLDVSKAKKEFGFTTKISLKLGLKKTIDWYRKNIS